MPGDTAIPGRCVEWTERTLIQLPIPKTGFVSRIAWIARKPFEIDSSENRYYTSSMSIDKEAILHCDKCERVIHGMVVLSDGFRSLTNVLGQLG